MEILYFKDLIKKGFNENTLFKEIAKLEKKFFSQYPYNVRDIKQFCQKGGGYTLILLSKNKIVGYLIPLLFKNKHYFQILTIAVDKNYQKKGCGTKLIAKSEEIAKSLKLRNVLIRADISYPILKILKNLKYKPMQLGDIKKFIKDGLFSSKDIIKNGIFNVSIPNLFPKAYAITKDIGKKNPYSFIPMIKKLS